MIKQTEYCDGSYSNLSRQVEIFVKSITTFQYPPVDNLQTSQASYTTLLLWAVVAGLRAGPKAGPKIFGPYTFLGRI